MIELVDVSCMYQGYLENNGVKVFLMEYYGFKNTGDSKKLSEWQLETFRNFAKRSRGKGFADVSQWSIV